MDRKTLLLTKVVELLQKQENSREVLNLLDETIEYDGAICDGFCLLNDIKDELELT